MLRFQLFFITISFFSFIQGQNVGIGTNNPDPSAALDVQSTTKGFLLPRMTLAQRDSILSPAVGLFIYNLDDECLQFYKGSSWSNCLSEDTTVITPPAVLESCLAYLNAGSTVDGIYSIDPDGVGPDAPFDCYCDMTTDGGGWTLVTSSFGEVQDQASAYYTELTTLSPTTAHTGLWDKMRPVAGTNSDIRFSARTASTGAFNVDLAFYDCTWYDVLTASTNEASVCFYNSNGSGTQHGEPARKNILTGGTLPLGDTWNAGYLEAEDACSEGNDFTIDFDDRGMDSNQTDGTDWGIDDGTQKCGTVQGGTYYFFIWVRE